MAAVDKKLIRFGVKIYRDAQRPDNLRDRLHVVKRRHFVQSARLLLPQKRRRDDRQHSVLRAAYLNPPTQGMPAVND